MQLGSFSVSLTVADLEASRSFYGLLGFEAVAGDVDEGWLVLRNGRSRLGLFQGLFESNLLTWNPPDVRAIQAQLDAAGVATVTPADPTGHGPTHLVVADPDGNRILLDQLD